MKIAFMSDLHIDFRADHGLEFLHTLEVPECDVLVVAGDLMEVACRAWESSVEKLCKMAPRVIYVAGNHENYLSSVFAVDRRLEQVERKNKNLTTASAARTFVINGVSFLVGTLWFPWFVDQDEYKGLLNDFNYIRYLEPECYKRNADFNIALRGIEGGPCVVITHHAPSYKSVNPKYAGEAINRFFVGGDFDDIIRTSKIKIWLHGHMHETVDYMIGNTRIVSNPLGYPNDISPYWKIKTVEV